jgi:hypothetical protein
VLGPALALTLLLSVPAASAATDAGATLPARGVLAPGKSLGGLELGFTVGVPRGWRTSRGVALGDPATKVHSVYGALPWSRCIGYGAVSIRRPGVVASIYTYGDSVYGFALTLPSEPVCQ